MPSFKVKVKWGRELYPDIEVNTDEEPMLFKAQLFALTGVQPSRQKIMCKGGILKDNEWNIPLKEGAVVLLMGSKDVVAEAPVQQQIVDEPPEYEPPAPMCFPPGLTNLGNTCYMNATIQCLRAVPELRDCLQSFEPDSKNAGSLSLAITSSLKYLFKNMNGGSTVTPIMLLQTLHRASPQFSQTAENGTYRQQDANECWSELLKMLQQNLPPIALENQAKTYKSFIEQFFGGTFDVTMKCNECEDDVSSSTEQFLQLSCFISIDVKYMQSGLKSKMKEQLQKRSATLGRDAAYTRSSLISRLPGYLTVQFVRFQYKSKEGINAKVLKDIKFPIDYDAYELCTPELQNKLAETREKFKILEDKKTETDLKAIEAMEQKSGKKKKEEYEDYWFADDYGSNNSGYYTLQAVLTHKGRSSSSGHYVAWVKHDDQVWFKFDDDVVSSVSTDEILRLSGGGDWHCAYVLLYGPKRLAKSTN